MRCHSNIGHCGLYHAAPVLLTQPRAGCWYFTRWNNQDSKQPDSQGGQGQVGSPGPRHGPCSRRVPSRAPRQGREAWVPAMSLGHWGRSSRDSDSASHPQSTHQVLFNTFTQRTKESEQPRPKDSNSLRSLWPGCPVDRIPQARILEWVSISFSRGSSQSRDRTHISCI